MVGHVARGDEDDLVLGQPCFVTARYVYLLRAFYPRSGNLHLRSDKQYPCGVCMSVYIIRMVCVVNATASAWCGNSAMLVGRVSTCSTQAG
jgi:hypothetical protein